MADTGILYRRGTKSSLIANPPVPGEIVFSIDTEEYGALEQGVVVWRPHKFIPDITLAYADSAYQPIDPDIVSDPNYTHTDNNYTTFEKSSVANIAINSTDISTNRSNINNIISGSTNINFDNTISGLVSTSIKGAIDEVTNLNNVHKSSTGADHSFIDQDVTTTGSPTFNSVTITNINGYVAADYFTKIDGIEANATADQTPMEILTGLKTVDGALSGLDSDLLDGQEGSFYQNASNLITGVIDPARLPVTQNSDTTGNAATATALQTFITMSFDGDVLGSASFDGSADFIVSLTVVDDSHSHDTQYYTKLESDQFFAGLNGSDLVDFNTKNLTVAGDLLVTGTTTTVNTQTLDIADNNITLNSDVTTAPVEDAGVTVNRGTSLDVQLKWDETLDVWQATEDGTNYYKLLNSNDAITLDVNSAKTLATPRTISLNGDVTGSASFDGSAAIGITAVVADDSHNHTVSTITDFETAVANSSAVLLNASKITNIDNTSDINKPISTATQTALDLKLDIADVYTNTEIDTVNLFRADKYLAVQNVANMLYNGTTGKLEKVRYNNDTDVDYEVLSYDVTNKLTNVAHYVSSTLKGNTVLSYSAGKLVSAIFTGV